MKSPPLPHLLLLLLPFLSAILFTEAQVPVLDSAGEPLQRGRLYYAQSIFRGAGGGGLTLAAAGNESCPSHVAKAAPVDWRGRALSFLPENSTAKTLTTGNTLYIRFSSRAPCSRKPALWQVSRGQGSVTIGGSTSTAVGPHFSRFSIAAGEGGAGGGYRIELCPCSVGVRRGSCRMGCLGALGVTSSRLLSLNADRPHLVTFVKVN